MQCLILDDSQNIKKTLCYILLSLGIKGILVLNYDDAKKEIDNNNNLSSVIIDVDNKSLNGIKLIEEINNKYTNKHLIIIIHTISTNRNFITKLIGIGINGILFKPFSAEKAAVKLKQILVTSNSHKNEHRKHIRIVPDPDELLRLYFRLPNSSVLVSGKIRNLSIGGVAVELFKSPKKNLIQKGIFLPKLQFTLNTREITPSGTILLFKKDILILRFNTFSMEDKHTLAEYIYNKITK